MPDPGDKSVALKKGRIRLADGDVDAERLRDAERDRARAEEEIGDAKDKVAAVVDHVTR
jgi:hypothetical protein